MEGGGFGGDKDVEEDVVIGRGGDRDRLGRGRRQGDVPIVVEGAEWSKSQGNSSTLNTT